jgi:hypothetical protein
MQPTISGRTLYWTMLVTGLLIWFIHLAEKIAQAKGGWFEMAFGGPGGLWFISACVAVIALVRTRTRPPS